MLSSSLLSKINMYPSTLSDSSPQSLYKGLLKTFVYAIVMLIALVAIMIQFGRPNAVVITLKKPTVTQYLDAAAANPTMSCACKVPSVTTSSIATMHLQIAGWCNRPAGTSLSVGYQQFCSQNPNAVQNGQALCPNGAPNAGLVAVIDQFCNFYQNSLASQLYDWNASSIFTPSLLSPSTLQSSYNGQLTTFKQRLAISFQVAFDLIGLYELYARPLTGFGYSATAMLVNGANNPSASTGYVSSSGTRITMGNALAQEYGTATNTDGHYLDATGNAGAPQLVFVPTRKGNFGFNTGVNNWGGAYCEGEFPHVRPGARSLVNVCAALAGSYNSQPTTSCSGFTYYTKTSFNVAGGEVSEAGVHAISSIAFSLFRLTELPQLPVAYFNMVGSLSDAKTTGLIDASSVETDFAAYFTTCAPDSCTYTLSSSPSTIELVTVVLGVLGGLSTVIRGNVSTGVNYFLMFLGFIGRKPKIFSSEGNGDKGGGAKQDKVPEVPNPMRAVVVQAAPPVVRVEPRTEFPPAAARTG